MSHKLMFILCTEEPPTDQGVAGVLSFMKENTDNEISIANALKQLNTYPSKYYGMVMGSLI